MFLVASMASVTVVLTGTSAFGSCVTRQRSADAFTGTVLNVTSDGKVATVRTEDGSTVTVIGGSRRSAVVTTVDRTYQVGVSYEFHPLNHQSPYRDNICTATHVLQDQKQPSAPGTPSLNVPETGPAASVSGGSRSPSGGASEPVDGSGQPSAAAQAVAGITVIGLAGSYLLLRRRSANRV